ncbi:MAG: hypothetical protein KDC23_03270 [Actinobacteria bacterium]|nr:hypothetical protein [Actinomycetota bacterium]
MATPASSDADGLATRGAGSAAPLEPRRTPVGNRLVSWLVLALGVFEVPWIIYLAFTQVTTVEADHLRLAGLVIGMGAAVLCGAAAWALWRGHPLAAALSVGSATLVLYLGISLALSPDLGTHNAWGFSLILFVALPGAVAGIIAARQLLSKGGSPHRRQLAVAAVVLAVVALTFAGHALLLQLDPETVGWLSRARAIVVILDTGESIGLIGAGIASLRGNTRAALVFSVLAATLLTCDAVANVLGAPPGFALESAVFYLLVGEIPSIVLSLVIARSAYRRLLPGD